MDEQAPSRPPGVLLAAIAVYVLLLAFVVFTHGDFGESWDEAFYLDTAEKYVAHFFAMDEYRQRVEERHYRTHGAFVDALYYLPLRAIGAERSLDALHLLKALASSLAVWGVFWLHRRLEPGSFAPVAAMLLLVSLPAWLGQIFDDHMDGSATVLYGLLMVLALPLLSRADGPVASPRRELVWALAFGATAGIAFSHRAPLLAVPAALFLVLAWRARPGPVLRRLAVGTVVFGVAFYVALFLFDPFVRLNWADGIFRRLFYSANPGIVADFPVLFGGEVLPSKDLPRTFLLRAMGMSIPLVTLLLFALGLVRLGGWLRESTGPRRDQAVFLLLCLGAPLAVAVAVHIVAFDGWRHFLFLAVPITLVAGLGFGWVLARLPARAGVWAWAALLVALGLVWGAMVRLHPYQYVYANELVGGLRGIDGRYETDYWAKSYREAMVWVRGRVEGDTSRTYRVRACGPDWVVERQLPENMVLTKRLEDADYVVCFTRVGGLYPAPRRAPDHVVSREGVVLSRVWELRGPG